MNRAIDEFAPWKNETGREDFLKKKLGELNIIGTMLIPFMPETAEKIVSSTGGKVKKAQPLFPRLI